VRKDAVKLLVDCSDAAMCNAGCVNGRLGEGNSCRLGDYNHLVRTHKPRVHQSVLAKWDLHGAGG